MEYILRIAAFIFLITESVEDLKSREVDAGKIIIFFLISLFLKMFCMGAPVSEIIKDIIPGVTVLLIGYFSKQEIGYGDGAVIVVLGIFLGFARVINILTGAFVCMLAASVTLVIIKRKMVNTPLPFIPCILVSYIGGFFI